MEFDLFHRSRRQGYLVSHGDVAALSEWTSYSVKRRQPCITGMVPHPPTLALLALRSYYLGCACAPLLAWPIIDREEGAAYTVYTRPGYIVVEGMREVIFDLAHNLAYVFGLNRPKFLDGAQL